MLKQISTMALAAAFGLPAQAVVSITAGGQSYGQNFDTLSATGPNTTNVTWANDSTLNGWSLFTRLQGSQAAAGGVAGAYAPTNYRVDDGTSNTGWFYSYGSAGSTDRAFGSIGSSSATGYWNTAASATAAGWIAVALTNNSGSALSGFTATYDGEEWRDGGNATPVAQSMTVEYGFGSTFASVTTWTQAGTSFTFTSPTYTATAGALNGNAGANRVAGLGGTINTNWAAGDTLWIRWVEVNDNGSDHALAIDNFSFTAVPVPEPGTYAMWLAGLLGVAFVAARRRG